MTNQNSKPEYFSVDLPVKYFNVPELLEFIGLLGGEILKTNIQTLTVYHENQDIIKSLIILKDKRISEETINKFY
jgi:hypothetical protein